MTEAMSNQDKAILEALEQQRDQDMETLRNGYRAIARFQAKMYTAMRQLFEQEWDQVLGAFAGRDEIWAQYAALLGKTVDELTDEDRMKGLIEARPRWPWDNSED